MAATKKDKFYDVLKNIFIGAKIEGNSGYVNLMRIKNKYYQEFKGQLAKDIDEKLNEVGRNFEEELYNKLYTFFKKYFSESGSIYFTYTPLQEKVYERIYRDDKDVMLFWKTNMLYYVKTERLYQNMDFQDEDNLIWYHFDVSELEHKQNNEKKELIFEYDKSWHEDNKREIFLKVKYSKNGSKTKIEDILKKIKKSTRALSSYKEAELKRALGIFRKQSEVDYFINKNAKEFLREQFSLWIKTYVFDDDTIFEEARLKQLKALRDIAYNIIDLVSQFEDELVKIWNKPKFAHSSNYVITLDKIAEKNLELLKKILTSNGTKEQIKEWQELGMCDEKFKIKDIFTKKQKDNKLFKKENNSILNEKWQYLPLDTKYFKEFEYDILALFDDLDNQLDGWLIHSENYQALNTLKHKFYKKVKCIHIDPPYNTDTSGFLYMNNYKSSSWLTMMENRINAAVKTLSLNGSFLCHIDENEYERLQLLFNQVDLPNAGTVIWDKRNPMNAGMGVATQHEYIIWRTRQSTPIYLRNDSILLILEQAQKIIKKHKGVNFEVKKEFSKWVKTNKDLTGGEKAYSNLDDEGMVYQSVSLRAPEYRTDKEFHKPLIHPITLKPCPVPPNGFSRTQDTLKMMVERKEILFGKDETIQPRQKVYLSKTTKRQISSVLQDAKKGKADLDNLGLGFSYNHPVSLYEKLIGAVTNEKNDIVFDFFSGSGTTAQATIELNKFDNGKRKYLLTELGNHFYTTIIPRIKKISFTDKWKGGKAQEGGTGYSNFFKYYELEQYEETLRKAKYEDKGALPKDIYHQYLFFKDLKLADEVIKLDDVSKSIKVDLTKLHEKIDIPETLSFLTGKFIKQIFKDKVVFTDGSEIEYDNIDYKIVKPLIWW